MAGIILDKATVRVPIAATVSRKTGEIRFEYSYDFMDQVRFGQVMNKISRLHEAYEDAKVKAEAETMSGAATINKIDNN